MSMDSEIRYDHDDDYCFCGHTRGSHQNGFKCLGCEDDWDTTIDTVYSDNINPYHRFAIPAD